MTHDFQAINAELAPRQAKVDVVQVNVQRGVLNCADAVLPRESILSLGRGEAEALVHGS